MSRCSEPAPVVVGVDGSGSALDALEWAAAEAATRGRPLRVVHAFTRPATVDPFGAVGAGDGNGRYLVAAELVLHEAVARARSVVPGGQVTSRLVIGPAARTMLNHAWDAELLVLGNRGLGGLHGLLTRSVGVQVVSRATCPVAVVHPFRTVAPGPSVARVVVGVDGSSVSTVAIGHAFQAAAQRGIGLTAVHAWVQRGPADLDGEADDPAAAEATARRLLDTALRRWRVKFPGVAILSKVVPDHPGHALLTESAGAALVVVGSRGRRGFRGKLLGSVSRTVLRHAHSPVAVIRHRPSESDGTR